MVGVAFVSEYKAASWGTLLLRREGVDKLRYESGFSVLRYQFNAFSAVRTFDKETQQIGHGLLMVCMLQHTIKYYSLVTRPGSIDGVTIACGKHIPDKQLCSRKCELSILNYCDLLGHMGEATTPKISQAVVLTLISGESFRI